MLRPVALRCGRSARSVLAAGPGEEEVLGRAGHGDVEQWALPRWGGRWCEARCDADHDRAAHREVSLECTTMVPTSPLDHLRRPACSSGRRCLSRGTSAGGGVAGTPPSDRRPAAASHLVSQFRLDGRYLPVGLVVGPPKLPASRTNAPGRHGQLAATEQDDNGDHQDDDSVHPKD